jgi:hypothetical protein
MNAKQIEGKFAVLGRSPGSPTCPRFCPMRLADVIKRIEAIPMGGTDCALPMVWAARNQFDTLNLDQACSHTAIRWEGSALGLIHRGSNPQVG